MPSSTPGRINGLESDPPSYEEATQPIQPTTTNSRQGIICRCAELQQRRNSIREETKRTVAELQERYLAMYPLHRCWISNVVDCEHLRCKIPQRYRRGVYLYLFNRWELYKEFKKYRELDEEVLRCLCRTSTDGSEGLLRGESSP